MKKNLLSIYITLLVVALGATSCYKDKGEYFTGKWSSIKSVTKLELPGGGVVFEGDRLAINPVVEYAEGYGPADFDFSWIIGTDTVARQLDLDWTVGVVSGMNTSGEAFVLLSIRNKRNGEVWSVYPPGNVNQPLSLRINLADAPQIGAIVYEKADGTVEWASIKGTKQDFKDKSLGQISLRTELLQKYNPSVKIRGKVISALMNDKDLVVYTDDVNDKGMLVRVTEAKNSVPYYPFGKAFGTVSEEIFSSDIVTSSSLKSVDHFYGIFQSALINDNFFITQASAEYPYIMLDPSKAGVIEGVSQVSYPVPATSTGGFFGLIRYNNNAVRMFKYTPAGAFYLATGALASMDLEEITGVFSQAPVTNTYTTMNFFVAGKKGSSSYLYNYTVSSSASNVSATYKSKMDITSLVDDNTIWFGTPSGTSSSILNPAFFTRQNQLYRINYSALAAQPVLTNTFDAPVTFALPVSAAYNLADIPNSLYTLVLTYNENTNTSSCYLLDVHSGQTLVSFVGEIPGKAIKYIPYMNK